MRLTPTGVLLLLFCLHAGLYAARNIPIAAIIMSLVLGPLLTVAISPKSDCSSRLRWLRSILDTGQGISDSMTRLESQLHGHVLAAVVLTASVALVLNGGRVLSRQILSAHFDERTLPVKAAEFVAQRAFAIIFSARMPGVLISFTGSIQEQKFTSTTGMIFMGKLSSRNTGRLFWDPGNGGNHWIAIK